MTTVSEKKKVLRDLMNAGLRSLTAMEREATSARLLELLWKEPAFIDARNIFCYVSMPDEADTRGLILRCLAEGKSVCIPRVVPGAGVIEARGLEKWDGSFTSGPFGILEPDPAVTPLADPAGIDLVIVPGLAFDRDGYRLGRGKGYYDRFLKALGPRAARIALAFAFQCVDRVPREPHDERIDKVLSA